MRRWMWMICFCFLGFCSCSHRELTDMNERRYIRVYLDEAIRNVSFGFYDENRTKPAYRSPEVIRAVFCHPEDGSIVSETYLQNKGVDERGAYIDGYVALKPGDYHLLMYNFDTESVHVRDEYNFYNMMVYTNPVSANMSKMKGKVVYEPDHFFREECELVHVDFLTDTLRTAENTFFEATTCVKSYYIQINVKGAEYVSSAVAFLSGMAGSVRLCDGQKNEEDPVSVSFTLNPEREKMVRGEVIEAYTTFNTFGKLEGQENYLTVTFEFYTRDGRTVTEEVRITDLFKTELVRVNQWIILDKTIVIDPPSDGDQGDGGIDPDVEEWVNVRGDIYL